MLSAFMNYSHCLFSRPDFKLCTVASSEKVRVKSEPDERGGFKPKASLSSLNDQLGIISIIPFAVADVTSRTRYPDLKNLGKSMDYH